MLEDDVELWSDREGGGGVEAEESCPQLVNKKPPVGVQFEPKETLIELLDLEENITPKGGEFLNDETYVLQKLGFRGFHMSIIQSLFVHMYSIDNP